jgi:hypothetical protein
MRKQWIAGLVLVLATAAPVVRADDASRLAKAHELFLVMHMDRMMNQMMGQMTDFVKQQVQETAKSAPGADQMTPAQKKLTDDFLNKAMDATVESLGWKTLEPQYAKLYAATYTDEELDGIIAFYKSAAGQAMLDKTPDVTAGTLKIVEAKMVDFQPQLKAIQDDYLKQMKAAGADAK